MAALSTHPLAVSKVRLQVQRAAGMRDKVTTDFGYKHQLHGIYQIYKSEGLKALYRGFTVRVAHSGTMSTFNMVTAEIIKKYLSERRQ